MYMGNISDANQSLRAKASLYINEWKLKSGVTNAINMLESAIFIEQ